MAFSRRDACILWRCAGLECRLYDPMRRRKQSAYGALDPPGSNDGSRSWSTQPPGRCHAKGVPWVWALRRRSSRAPAYAYAIKLGRVLGVAPLCTPAQGGWGGCHNLAGMSPARN